jgi:hypothetical protein
MTRTFRRLLLAFVASAAATMAGHAQGTINFANQGPGLLDAPAFDVAGGDRIAGPDAFAQLYAAPNASSLLPVGTPVAFLSGPGAGYWPPTVVSVPTVRPGEIAAVQVAWWKGAQGSTYESAAIRCSSTIFEVSTGGAGDPPSAPANLVGLHTLICIPEPMIPTLALVSMVLVWFARSPFNLGVRTVRRRG